MSKLKSDPGPAEGLLGGDKSVKECLQEASKTDDIVSKVYI